MKQLSAASGETASFYVRHEDKRIALFRVEPARAVRAAVQVGQEYAIAQGASGKVLLAFTQPPGVGLDQIRSQLWAVSYGERDPETASVAAPVFGVTGELQGALTLSAPRDRLARPEAMHKACGQVLEAAKEATQALGGEPHRFVKATEGLSVGRFA